ncbi:MerR family transcriptional regulator [Nocardia sp. NPDC048505]|uniref:MerR family transcriptional regulator n=1 Tax=unclassified Nocardia TaxID=2637762 RepID=UPI003404E848
MLTIGRLAATAGVSVRTVRHYHQVGLLAEPERDASGYRRYSAQAAVDLIRIRTLAEAGVPLGRIEALLRAEPGEFAAAVAEIDAELVRKVRQLNAHRRRIAALESGERLVLPPGVVGVLERMRGLGIGERRVRMERDAWILLQAMEPGALPGRVRDKHAELDDPETVRLFSATDTAAEWDANDPRLDQLIDDLDVWQRKYRPNSGDSALIAAGIAEASPAWRHVIATLAHRARQRRPGAAKS